MLWRKFVLVFFFFFFYQREIPRDFVSLDLSVWRFVRLNSFFLQVGLGSSNLPVSLYFFTFLCSLFSSPLFFECLNNAIHPGKINANIQSCTE